MKALLLWLARQLYPLFVVIWINGLMLRVTLRDSVDTLAPLYYLTPWPVIAVLTLPFIWTFRRNPKGVFGVIVLAHLFGAAWIMEDWRSADLSKEPSNLRVVHWNVSRPKSSFTAITETFRAWDADIIGISEALPKGKRGDNSDKLSPKQLDSLAEWKSAFPTYAASYSQGNMLCLVRGEILDSTVERIGEGSRAAIHHCIVGGRDLRVIQVDLWANPLRSRRQPMAALIELIKKQPPGPLLLLGDFNTPRNSVHFDPLRLLLKNTFEQAGVGSGDTWPMPLPVLSLDQIWCSPDIRPIRCHHAVSFRSDHRAVITDLNLDTANPN